MQEVNKEQETIEEATEKLSKNAYKKHSVKDDTLSLDEQIQRSGGFIVGFKEGMIEGAKWQADRMYSEEEVRKIAWDGRLFFHENKDTPFSNMRTSFIKWFEQHKNK